MLLNHILTFFVAGLRNQGIPVIPRLLPFFFDFGFARDWRTFGAVRVQDSA